MRGSSGAGRSALASGVLFVVVFAGVGCGSNDGYDESSWLTRIIPDADALKVGLDGEWAVKEVKEFPPVRTEPRRPSPVGRRSFIIVTPHGVEFQVHVFLYSSPSVGDARELWSAYPPERAHGHQATNVVDRDSDDVARRLDRWSFEIPPGRNGDARGVCLAGWNARGLSGCGYPVLWSSFCSWNLDITIGVSIIDPPVDDVAAAFRGIEDVIREVLSCP